MWMMLRSAFKQKIIVFCSIRVCTCPFAPWFFRGARCCLVPTRSRTYWMQIVGTRSECAVDSSHCWNPLKWYTCERLRLYNHRAPEIVGERKLIYIFTSSCSCFCHQPTRHYDDWISWHFNKWWIARCHTFTGKNQTFFFLASMFFSLCFWFCTRSTVESSPLLHIGSICFFQPPHDRQRLDENPSSN